MERQLNRTYHFAIKSQSNRAISYDNINTKKLREIRLLNEHFTTAFKLLMKLKEKQHSFTSSRLKKLLSEADNSNSFGDEAVLMEGNENQTGILPNINHHLKEFSAYLKWEEDIPIPQKGLVAEYDQMEEKIEEKKG